MNKIVILICATLFIALYACDERDDLRSDINDLKEWVTDMEAGIEQMNTDINSYQQMVAGKVFVSGYEQDELGKVIDLKYGEEAKEANFALTGEQVVNTVMNLAKLVLNTADSAFAKFETTNGTKTTFKVTDEQLSLIHI